MSAPAINKQCCFCPTRKGRMDNASHPQLLSACIYHLQEQSRVTTRRLLICNACRRRTPVSHQSLPSDLTSATIQPVADLYFAPTTECPTLGAFTTEIINTLRLQTSSGAAAASSSSPTRSDNDLLAELHQRLEERVTTSHPIRTHLPDALKGLAPQVDKWLHESDVHNHWGCEFLPVHHHSNFLTLHRECGRPSGAQSGEMDKHATAQSLWDELSAIVAEYMEPYQVLATAGHASDLLTAILSVHHLLCCLPSSDEIEIVLSGTAILDTDIPPVRSRRPALVTFQRNYYGMEFTVPTWMCRQSVTTPILRVSTDPSIQLSQSPSSNQAKKEHDALKELRALLHDDSLAFQICGVLIEPIIIPGGGCYYRGEFLLALQQLCIEQRLLLIADETISAVRCGAPLWSLTIPNFRPHLVMIGKGLGINLLLLHSTAIADTFPLLDDDENEPPASLLLRLWSRSSSLIAPASQLAQATSVLYLCWKKQYHDQCAKEGTRIHDYFKAHNIHAHGIGLCWWLQGVNLATLPLVAGDNGRMLLRLDQGVHTFQYVMSAQATEFFQTLVKGNALDVIRNPNCSLCGAGRGSVLWCLACPRVFHDQCIDQAIKSQLKWITTTQQPVTKDTCICGGAFYTEVEEEDKEMEAKD